ncbi:MAG: TldD/PmbA family protein [Cyanobacteriota bacterium]|nr:TldD/PmbA family protein [Cyanobacteriota bacterium]
MTSLDHLADSLQAKAEHLGIHKFDIYGATVDEISVQVDRGDPKQVKASQRSSVTVRVWNAAQQTVGVTSTTDLDADGLQLALQMAQEASGFGNPEHMPDFSPAARDPLPMPRWETPPQAPAALLIDRLVEAEKALLAAHPAIKGVPYNGLAQRDIDRFYLNSQGSRRQESQSLTSIYLYSKTEQEGRKPRSAGAFRISRSLADLDIAGCLQEAADKTISHLDYQKIPTGKYTVIFSPEAFLGLLGAFSNVFNAQNILDKQSLSTPESLGQPIASPLLSIADDAQHPRNVGSITFDGEGTPTRRLEIIQAGILSHFLHSARTAQRLGSQPTGHANIGAKVTVGAHFYDVYAARQPDHPYDLAQADQVIWIDDLHALHAGVKATQGSFSLPFDGWLIQKGEKISIESATVAGDFLDVLQSIIYVDPQAELTASGVCPPIWVEGLSITGE